MNRLFRFHFSFRLFAIGATILFFASLVHAEPKSLTSKTSIRASQSALQYGQECAANVSPVPAFSCMNGEVIPILVNGVAPANYTAGMTCDKPSLLLDETPNNDGQCVPNSRAILLRDDRFAQVTAICRQKKIRTQNLYLFDEIDIVAHNVRNGSTCWFRALVQEPLNIGTGIDGRNVPSATNPTGTVWDPPAKTAAGLCVTCHDSSPYMYSPYVAQTTAVPNDALGKYQNNVGADFRWWPIPRGITTRGNTCTTCHHMGNMNSCHVALKQSIGQLAFKGQDQAATQYPLSHWMAPGNLHSKMQWEPLFAESAAKLAACCENPNLPGCEVVHYNTLKKQSVTRIGGNKE